MVSNIVTAAPLGGCGLAVFSGLCSYTGGLLFTTALSNGGEASVVGAVVASYPAIAFVMSVVFFGEPAPPAKVIGVVLAVASTAFFAYQPSSAVGDQDAKKAL